MNLTISSGSPLLGRASVTLKTIVALQGRGVKVGVVKLDCLYTGDNVAYEKAGVPAKRGPSSVLCPGHFFASGIEEIVWQGNRIGLDLLISKSVELCNRYSPYLRDIKDTCAIDNPSGISTSKKIGSLLESADVVVTTKGDIVSQAEREVFASRVGSVNPRAVVMHVSGLTGQGAYELRTFVYDEPKHVNSVQGVQLCFPVPAALCSYCLGETRIGEDYQLGNVKEVDLGEDST